jgi:hypothetical protein
MTAATAAMTIKKVVFDIVFSSAIGLFAQDSRRARTQFRATWREWTLPPGLWRGVKCLEM